MILSGICRWQRVPHEPDPADAYACRVKKKPERVTVKNQIPWKMGRICTSCWFSSFNMCMSRQQTEHETCCLPDKYTCEWMFRPARVKKVKWYSFRIICKALLAGTTSEWTLTGDDQQDGATKMKKRTGYFAGSGKNSAHVFLETPLWNK